MEMTWLLAPQTQLWEGSINEGRGQMSVGSGAFEGAYSFQSRFGGGRQRHGAPEELIAAAHAGCFTMALSLVLGQGGNEPESLRTSGARDPAQPRGHRPHHHQDHAHARHGRVPGHRPGRRSRRPRTSPREGFLVSRALAGVDEIALEATLES